MKNISFFTILTLIVMTVGLSSCSIVQDIFELGFWAGISIVILVIVLIVVGVVKLLK